MPRMPVPQDRLAFFQERIGLGPDDAAAVRRFRSVFAGRGAEFAVYLYDGLMAITPVRSILEHETTPVRIKQFWATWFEHLLARDLTPDFLANLWRSGLTHVSLSIDHRYVNLAYSLARQFCQSVTTGHVPEAERPAVDCAVDKLIDLCILVETDAFIAATTQCDREVIQGIAHQMRNPLTIIGGNVKRLRDRLEADDPYRERYDTVLDEARRLERMVNNIAAFNEIYRKEPLPRPCSLSAAVAEALVSLNGLAVPADVGLSPENAMVMVDPDDLRLILFHLLQNAMEAAREAASTPPFPAPRVMVSARPRRRNPRFVDILVHNTGTPPRPEDLPKLFTPFFSTKAFGTGFGLPIARLAAKKNMGNVRFLSARPGVPADEGAGVTVVLTLPAAPPESGNQ